MANKKAKKVPTKPNSPIAIKQAKVLQHMSENVGKSGNSLTQAAIAAGYSESYAKSGRLQKTKTWEALVEDLISDEKILKRHTQLLNKEEVFSTKAGIIKTGQPHSDVARGLDMAYKLKKRYTSTVVVQNEYKEMTDEELEKETAAIMAEAIDLLEEKGVIYRV